MQGRIKAYKIGVSVPADHMEILMDRITEVIEPLYPKYDRTFMYWPVKGTWRPLPGSNPFEGTVGEIETADLMRLEFAVKEEDVGKAVKTIADNHPYEEPAIDITPMIPWKDVIPSDDT